MFTLKKKYLQDINNRDIQIKSNLSKIAQLKDNDKVLRFRLENANHKIENLEGVIKSLQEELVKANQREEAYFKVNHKINEDRKNIDDKYNKLSLENKKLKIRSNTLEKCYIKADNERNRLGRAFNVMNKRLWCNDESKRQIRELSTKLLEGKKIPYKDLGLALRDISMYMAGGEHLKFEGKVKTNG